jgi:hypothetical protein
VGVKKGQIELMLAIELRTLRQAETAFRGAADSDPLNSQEPWDQLISWLKKSETGISDTRQNHLFVLGSV